MADTEHKKIPEVMWAQRADVVYLTINLSDVQKPTINLTENDLFFSGTGGSNKEQYEIKLDFYAPVNVSESKYGVQARDVCFVIKKKEEGPYWPHLLKGIKKAFWLKTDFNKWKDEDDSDDEPDKNMDLSEMMQNLGGGMGGMGGMGMGDGGMPDDLGGEADEEDSDDENLPDLE